VLYSYCFLGGCGFNSTLSVLLRYLYMSLTFTPCGLYSVLKLRDLFPVRRGLWLSKDEIIWWSFAVVVASSDVLWCFSDVVVWLGPPVLFPTVMLLAIHSETAILTAVRQWCRGFRGASATMPGDQGQQPAQGHQHV
jgi:hypothetical protein